MVATGEVQLGLLASNKIWEWGKGKEDGKLTTLINNVKNVNAGENEAAMKQKELMLHLTKAKNPAMLAKISPLREVALIAAMSSLVQSLSGPLKLLKQNTERLDRVHAAQTEDYISDNTPTKRPKTSD